MAIDVIKSIEIIEIMENYIFKIRPPQEIRDKLDVGYEIEKQSIILNEIRPFWDNPNKIMTIGYAKATFIHAKNIWKIYWKRADGKWHLYKPSPDVVRLQDFLKVVDEDKHSCFRG